MMIKEETKQKNFSKETKRTNFDGQERILDVPGIMDDFYLNILDWSSKNIIAIGLTENLYLYNYLNSKSFKLTNLKNGKYISSIKFEEKGNFIAIGTSEGVVEIWDIEKEKKVRNLIGGRRENERITSLDWNDYTLSSGGLTNVINHDVRIKEHITSKLNFHSSEVCSLKWSNDKKYISTGGNDNLCFIFDKNKLTKPLIKIDEHKGAVKSIEWHKGNRNIFFTGGGKSDGSIKVWNISKGKKEEFSSIQTNSQVSSIISSNYEFLSSHGMNDGNQLSLWDFKDNRVPIPLHDFKGHTSRILTAVQCPCLPSKVASVSSDETIRIWNIFQKDEGMEKNSPLSIKYLDLR
jgi:cell division cycle 20, cofactor of APC complex